jgi:hypothetical protein
VVVKVFQVQEPDGGAGPSSPTKMGRLVPFWGCLLALVPRREDRKVHSSYLDPSSRDVEQDGSHAVPQLVALGPSESPTKVELAGDRPPPRRGLPGPARMSLDGESQLRRLSFGKWRLVNENVSVPAHRQVRKAYDFQFELNARIRCPPDAPATHATSLLL